MRLSDGKAVTRRHEIMKQGSAEQLAENERRCKHSKNFSREDSCRENRSCGERCAVRFVSLSAMWGNSIVAPTATRASAASVALHLESDSS